MQYGRCFGKEGCPVIQENKRVGLYCLYRSYLSDDGELLARDIQR